jgi:hypothetical protein
MKSPPYYDSWRQKQKVFRGLRKLAFGGKGSASAGPERHYEDNIAVSSIAYSCEGRMRFKDLLSP